MEKSAIIKAAQSCVPDFKECKESDLYVEPLKGGLTNLLWTVGLKSEKESSKGKKNITEVDTKKSKTAPTIVLIREYGQGTESFMNRKQEERVVQKLSEEGLCPKVFGAYPWGRVENFMQDARPLTTAEYASHEFMENVAEVLGKFHSQSPHLLKLCSSEGNESCLEERLNSWYKIASQVKFEGDDEESKRKQRKLDALDITGTIKKEMKWILDEIKAVKSPVAFCHCDLQEGNLLYNNKELHMIDFEYSDRLERGFDIGNCFCEMSLIYNVTNYPGFYINPDEVPDLEKRARFVESYAKGLEIKFDKQTKKQLLKEGSVFVMGSHFHWVLWSIVQAENSTIEFGYVEYAEQRLDQYYRAKLNWKKLCEEIDAL